MDCPVWALWLCGAAECAFGPPRAAALEFIVVRVVVRERSEGDGEEKVLPLSRVVLGPPVAAVHAAEEFAWNWERPVSRSVLTVGALEVLSAVCGGMSSVEDDSPR